MKASEGYLLDELGRRLLVHGVNLGGSSKVPSRPNGATHIREGFYDHRDLSFVGRPFPLSEADEHFTRLNDWGLGVVRLLVTWEAVEHSGPGIYDSDYLDYLASVAAKAGEHGIRVIVDFHQDAWSRFSGGDGAPGWTLEAAGMDIRRIDATGAAITHQAHVDPYEKMVWSTNGRKLAAATMFTLFFGGNDFAPGLRVGDTPIQEYLQGHYLAALQRLAERLSGLSNVIGFDPMNEPLPGYIGCNDLREPVDEPRIGAIPSPLQSMALGAGFPQEVQVWRFGPTGSRRRGKRVLNSEGITLWVDGCPWRRQGVWDIGDRGAPRVLRADYFRSVDGRPVDFVRDYYRPFLAACADVIHRADSGALLFLEPAQGTDHVAPYCTVESQIVSAPHWYDGPVLMLKRFNSYLGADSLRRRVVLGRRRIRQSYRRQIETLKRIALERFPGAPTFVGEIGIPFDLHAACRTKSPDDLTVAAMERSLRTMDDALVSYALWNYTPDNTGEYGDLWNEEDLSIYNREMGGRALDAVVRPYARAVAGIPLRMSFDRQHRRFELEFEHDPAVAAPTELFVPKHHYPNGCHVELSDGHYESDPSSQIVRYHHTHGRSHHWIRLRRPVRDGDNTGIE